MFNSNIPASSLLSIEGSGLLMGGHTPKTPEILNSLIAMTNPLDNFNFGSAAAAVSATLSASSSATSTPVVAVRHFNGHPNGQSHSQDSSHSSCSGSPLESPAGTATTPSVQQSQPKGLTPEDEDRRRRRRERNKIAATKCRMKKRERTQNLIKESEVLDTQNVELKQQVRLLETERRNILDMLQSHGCQRSSGCQLPSQLLQSPAQKYLSELELETVVVGGEMANSGNANSHQRLQSIPSMATFNAERFLFEPSDGFPDIKHACVLPSPCGINGINMASVVHTNGNGSNGNNHNNNNNNNHLMDFHSGLQHGNNVGVGVGVGVMTPYDDEQLLLLKNGCFATDLLSQLVEDGGEYVDLDSATAFMNNGSCLAHQQQEQHQQQQQEQQQQQQQLQQHPSEKEGDPPESPTQLDRQVELELEMELQLGEEQDPAWAHVDYWC
ncbi:hypothetical protein M5D96_013339 [Drosophila gunungcola]|uniref:BZIP domain-containing protein n=1 Tax=Drosophila gunungcola TaxID=103775 RepID=A0A9P9YCA1_9MUSC|nr:hypothetical protein M5D96_013339 [Drosophila gunungcola]